MTEQRAKYKTKQRRAGAPRGNRNAAKEVKRVNISLTLPPSTLATLKKLAALEGGNRSQLVERLIEAEATREFWRLVDGQP